ncbi:MAG: molybdate ABC transporter substrate-binding protein [Longimicrobiales bacterium]|nr:molybdate ABC transporter substrate-binding protein [Longimicrobiales bacterium]
MRWVRVGWALVLAVAGWGCAQEGGGALRVSAAASLTDALAELADAFQAAHPGTAVALNLAGSATLATQVIEGAPVDVFLAADTATMGRVAAVDRLAGSPVVFARNRVALAVPAGNPAGVRGLADLARPELLVGLCAAAVPCGAAARAALAGAGVRPSVDTEEPHVRALLTRLELGELDAGIVYATDVLASAEVEAVPLEPGQGAETAYPAAVVRDAPDPEAARAFVAFLLSPPARAILARYGFSPP